MYSVAAAGFSIGPVRREVLAGFRATFGFFFGGGGVVGRRIEEGSRWVRER